MITRITEVSSYFGELRRTIERIPLATIEDIATVLLNAYNQDRTIFLFGNGGSAALASHMACDLGKGTLNGSGKRLRAVALTDNVPLMTAWANDSAYENIFAEQLANLVRPHDVAFGISGSGNSGNVLLALQAARKAGAVTVGLTGFQGGKVKDLCDACMIVPSENMQIIEDLHLCVSHALFTVIRAKLREPVKSLATSV